MRLLWVVLGFALALSACGGSPIPAIRPAGDTMTFTSESGSMEPTLPAGAKFEARRVSDYLAHRGDIVVFTQADWMPEDPQMRMVKRVIGIPGDRITCCDELGRISLNGVPQDEPFIKNEQPCNGPMIGCDWSTGPVPDGGLFVLGDHRDDSADSSFHMCRIGQTDCDPNGHWVWMTDVLAVIDP